MKSTSALLLPLSLLACGDDRAPVRPVHPRPTLLIDGGTTAAGLDLLPPCPQKRVAALYAIPGDLTKGEGTRIEAALGAETPAASARVSWLLWNDQERSARGTLKPLSACQPGSFACARFVCLDPGSDARGTAAPSAWVVMRYEDDDCYEMAKVVVACLPPSALSPGVDARAADDPGGARDAGERQSGDDAIAVRSADAAAVGSRPSDGAAD